MPSPTWATRPTVRASSEGSKPSRCFLSADAMSAAEMVSSAIRFVLVVGAVWMRWGHSSALSWSSRERTVPSMTVSPTVATRPPSTAGSTIDLHLDLLAGGVGQGGGEAGLLVVGERHGRADLGDGAVLLRGGPLDELVDDGGQVAAAAGADHEPHQLGRGGGGLAAEEVLDDGLAPLDRDQLVGQGVAQLVGALEVLGEAEQLVLDLVEVALGLGHRETGRRRSRRCGRSLGSALAADVGDEVLDEALHGGVVELRGDELLGGVGGQLAHLALELGGEAAARACRCRRRPWRCSSATSWSSRARPSHEDPAGGLVGLGEHPGPLGVDVAELASRMSAAWASASALALAASVELALDALAAGLHPGLHGRHGELPEQEGHDQEGDAHPR